jgi:hypothetical protein
LTLLLTLVLAYELPFFEPNITVELRRETLSSRVVR